MKAVVKVSQEGRRLRIAVRNEGEVAILLQNRANSLVVGENMTRLLRIDESEREVEFELLKIEENV